MTKKLRILITNDDGISASGIEFLYNAVKHFADVTVVAPLEEQSGKGLATSINSPLRLCLSSRFEKHPTYTVNGTPADCVKLGINLVLKEKPDIILSGINRGSNAGKNVLYSGTVGGVIEGALRHIPGIAFSCVDHQNPDYEKTVTYIPKILDFVLTHPLPKGTILNVNFPSKHLNLPYQGFKLARQGEEFWIENPAERKHPFEDHSYYWLGGKNHKEQEDNEESDTYLLKQGFITAVPVHVGELTDHGHLKAKRVCFESFF